jgi:hypothetical protein
MCPTKGRKSVKGQMGDHTMQAGKESREGTTLPASVEAAAASMAAYGGGSGGGAQWSGVLLRIG